MTDTRLTNELADLAEQVAEAAAAVKGLQRSTSEMVMKAGRLLVEAKSRCAHGEWLAFLDRAGLQRRSSQRFMALARAGIEIDTIEDLGGMGGALAFLRAWRLPTYDGVLMITSTAYGQEKGQEAEMVSGPIVYVWRADRDCGHLVIKGFVNDGSEMIQTKRPMLDRVDFAGEAPVDTALHWLRLHFPVAIDDWKMEMVPRRLPAALLGGL